MEPRDEDQKGVGTDVRGRDRGGRAGRPRTDADVLIVGGGPVGLTLAAELRVGGVRPLVLERHAELGRTHNANGLGGQIIELLRCRGLLDRFVAAATNAHPRPVYPFGGVQLDLRGLADPPLTGIQLEHPSVDRLLDERALELGAEIRRGHRVVGLTQDDRGVRVEAEGPDGRVVLTGRYLVACDGAYSRTRGMGGIAFPGTTYPEVHRLAEVAVHPAVTVGDDGGVELPGGERIAAGFTRTAGGVFAMGSLTPDVLMVQTIEDEDGDDGDAPPMTPEELGESIRRVLGVAVPLGEPRRLSRYRHHARQAERYRAGRVFLAGDAAHVLPATGIARSVGMLDAVNLGWKLAAAVRGDAPEGLLDTYELERRHAGARALLQTQAQVALRRGHDDAADALRAVVGELLADEAPARRLAALVSGADVRYPPPAGAGPGAAGPDGAGPGAPGPGADDRHPLVGRFVPGLALRTEDGPSGLDGLLRTGRPLLLDLADRAALRDAARGWHGRVEVLAAETDDRPADALLIRPDGHVAWAAAVDEPDASAAAGLREALRTWVGTR